MRISSFVALHIASHVLGEGSLRVAFMPSQVLTLLHSFTSTVFAIYFCREGNCLIERRRLIEFSTFSPHFLNAGASLSIVCLARRLPSVSISSLFHSAAERISICMRSDLCHISKTVQQINVAVADNGWNNYFWKPWSLTPTGPYFEMCFQPIGGSWDVILFFFAAELKMFSPDGSLSRRSIASFLVETPFFTSAPDDLFQQSLILIKMLVHLVCAWLKGGKIHPCLRYCSGFTLDLRVSDHWEKPPLSSQCVCFLLHRLVLGPSTWLQEFWIITGPSQID